MSERSVLVRLKGDATDLDQTLVSSAAKMRLFAAAAEDADGSIASIAKNSKPAARGLRDVDSELKSVEGNSRRVVRGLDDVASSSNRSDGPLRSLVRNLDQVDGRLAGIVQTGLALGPALVPLGAAAVPALAGLSLQLGLSVAAGAAAITAFHGVGDALGALNDFKINPTTKNLAKLQTELDGLGPAGQEFVFFLRTVQPELERLQALAEKGVLPGAQEGIEELLHITPQVESLLFNLSTTLGNLLAEAGDNLNDQRWVDFFEYLDKTAGPVLTEMGKTFGNFLEGIANLFMAFDPLSRSFSEGLLEASQSFAEWTANVDDTQGFQDFLTYVQTNGPKAIDALQAIGGLFLDIVEAAAPVGAVVLPVITGLADGFAAIIDSPVGPILVSAAAGIGLVGRSLKLLEVVGLRGGGTGIVAQAIGTERIKASIPTLNQVGSVLYRAGQSAEFASSKTIEARSAVRGFAGAVGPAAAAVAGLTLATTGLAEKTGLSNTLSLALMGTMAGPYGAAIGGAIGFAKDLSAATGDVADSLERVEVAARQPLDFAGNDKALADLRSDIEASSKIDFSGVGDGVDTVLRLIGNAHDQTGAFLTSQESDAAKAAAGYDKAAHSAFVLRANTAQLYADLHGGSAELLGASATELQTFINSVVPAAQAAGIDIVKALKSGDLQPVVQAVRDYSQAQKDAFTDSNAVDEAMRILSGETLPGLTAATDLNSDGIISNTEAILANVQAMKDKKKEAGDAIDAEIAYQEALDAGPERLKERADLQKQIKQAAKDGEKERADLQRSAGEAGADQSKNMQDLQRRLAAARADVSTAKTSSARSSARESVAGIQSQIDDQSVGSSRAARAVQEQIQASLDRQAKTVADLKARLKDYTLTLDLDTKAGRENMKVVKGISDEFNGLSDKQKNAKGKFEETRAALIKQAMQFGATRKQAQGFAKDLLEIPPRVQAKLELDKKQAAADLAAFKKAFYGLTPKTVELIIKRRNKGILGDGGKLDRAGVSEQGYATGGYTGPGGKYEPAGIVHRGEFVIDAEQTARHRDILEAIHRGAPGYDIGGYVDAHARREATMRSYASGGYVGGTSVAPAIDYKALTRAVLAARPLRGDTHLHTLNHGAYLREQADADRRASLEGGRSR